MLITWAGCLQAKELQVSIIEEFKRLTIGWSKHSLKLALKGARSLLGMLNILKIMDDDNGGTYDIQEFLNALCEFRVARYLTKNSLKGK